MSGFTDMMIDDGFSDPEEYMEYLENRFLDRYESESWSDDDRGHDDVSFDEFDDDSSYDDEDE
jgi:hypothetical protein